MDLNKEIDKINFIKKCICSCKTQEQIDSAMNMVHNYKVPLINNTPSIKLTILKNELFDYGILKGKEIILNQ